MAAKDPNSRLSGPPEGDFQALTAMALLARLDEEIGRAERHGTGLSCLLVKIEDLEEMARKHGSQLAEQTVLYVAGALGRELRRFDRIGRPSDGELLIVLPGADGLRGELVAKRVLERMRTIKLEAEGARRPLEVTIGLAAWRANMATAELLERSRTAACSPDGSGDHRPGEPAREAREGTGTGVGRGGQGPFSARDGPTGS
jgi:GGDEF domain-containing protein